MPAVARVSLAGVAASHRPSVHADYLHHYQLEEHRPFWRTGKGLFVKGVLLAWFIVAIAYAAFLLYGERHGQEREVRVTRASLSEKSLPSANTTLPRGANNQAAREIQRDSGPGEQRRDDALQSADRCASQRAWDCVREKASEALAIDPGSLHARSLMERAILATGWSPLRTPNGPAQSDAAVPRPRDASSVPLPSSRDWGAATPATPAAPIAPATVASPPPLPSASSTPANGHPADVESADTSVTSAAANQSAAADATVPGSNDDGADTQERAIRQLGWKDAPSSEGTH
ncbi:MAG TPA: hypothetical protein VJU59_45650 [Paraburkholderia sp.]|uniref:hypothetical protein n=1 Tax=Paraburkholderia sp. TaxID=1926495 RepID=UPI002B4A87C4|nr:hypothetical protein [Paraburkholderia sp.]HKR46877.1 hypothetical protein [Paraburkholderia sp.]